jgi:hypothetical protein
VQLDRGVHRQLLERNKLGKKLLSRINEQLKLQRHEDQQRYDVDATIISATPRAMCSHVSIWACDCLRELVLRIDWGCRGSPPATPHRTRWWTSASYPQVPARILALLIWQDPPLLINRREVLCSGLYQLNRFSPRSFLPSIPVVPAVTLSAES